ncbi:uncharacterized protein LOC114297907 [Camellia sinensis]|uniref:uncharacterized protein LOC114297907 n=1 Tax=Camellia sinensis TaxID=4442 RepID=UPI001036A9F6|nr:uncharacterized protein LOC114297907 [Camellia sinensis]
MGGGHFLIESTRYDALKSPSGGDINPHTYEFTNSRKLYDVKDEGNKGAYFGPLILYGGLQNNYGDTYDCVDFYKQPAFDHPLLKNHTFHFQMKPTSLPKRSRDQVSSNVSKPLHIGLKGGGCPVGTVPIRRTTKEDLIREKLASKIITPADDTGSADYAIVKTIDGPNKYSGASAVLSVYQPDVVGKQYSAGRMMIQNGLDSLQVGWRAGQSHCFNTNCPGFVIVDTEIPLGQVIEKVSIRGGTSVAMEIYILQWLGVANTNLGFWPKRILGGGLANLASHAEWGGEVFSPPGTPKPAMGGGHFLIEDTRYDTYFRNIALKSPSGGDINPQTYEFTSNRKQYEVKDEGYQGAHFGHLVLYGGPGGS